MSDADAIIQVTDVWKRFTIRTGQVGDLRERFNALRAPKKEAIPESIFWALKDVSFSVGPGQSLGIVGHNGSGKSTLLKLLTGILKPTQGEVKMKGRVGALIEVGAGFHPDLSGRENIFLNGSILGLSRREIERKFDDIVAFAGLEKFVDTPVKRYSSGMYMRLGFAVAAHTDPDILLIDEVLAVGDTFFQRKCLRHLENFVKKGGAVVFVSHAMTQVSELCETCLWLDHGELKHYGPTHQAIEQYMALVEEREDDEFRLRHPEEWAVQEEERQRLRQEAERREAEEKAVRDAEEAAVAEAAAKRRSWLMDPTRARLRGITLRDGEGRPTTAFEAGSPMRVEIYYHLGRPLPRVSFGFEIFRKSDHLHMFSTSNFDHELVFEDLPTEGMVAFDVPFLSPNAGEYVIYLQIYSDWRVGAWHSALEDEWKDAITFTVSAGRFGHGCAFLPVKWEKTPRAIDPKVEFLQSVPPETIFERADHEG
jgi:ABC-type branched-subunit amino acid transport system ATPase component